MEVRNTENSRYGKLASANPPPDSDFITATRRTSRERVVIVGCGFGGLIAVKLLRNADVDVTVIDRTNHHLFQPLYQVATGILSEGVIAPPVRDILRDQQNANVVFGEIVERQLVVRVKSVRSSTPWSLIERLNLARRKRCQKRVDRLVWKLRSDAF